MTNPFFPHLVSTGFSVTSAFDPFYNCIAWAADDNTKAWWPDPNGYWPPGVPVEVTLPAFIEAFATLGYKRCNDSNLEPGYEKVAIYADVNGTPTHAARQLATGEWTSKLGKAEDISHTLTGVTGPFYGQVAQLLRRPS